LAKQKSKAESVGKPDFKGFVNYSLSEGEREACKRTEMSLESLESMLKTVEDGGYKLFLSFDFKNSVYQAAMTCNELTHFNAGWFLTGRGSTPVKALKQLFYMHFTIFGSSWPHEGQGKMDLDD